MSELLDKIRSRSHWRVVIRPGSFDERRVTDLSTLRHILEKTSVRYSSRLFSGRYEVESFVTRSSFPHIGEGYDEGADWIGQETDDWPVESGQLWRFYQSGQFVCYSGMLPNHAKFLHPEDVIIRFSEIFELAARLSRTEAGDDWMHLEVTAAKIAVPLWIPSGRADLSRPATVFDNFSKLDPATTDQSYQADLSMLELLTKPRELALEQAVNLFQRFGWNPHLSFLRDYQDELLPRRSGALR